MADFNVKEIQQLKLKIQVGEKVGIGAAVLTGVALYYDWDTWIGLLIAFLIVLLIVMSRWKKKLRQKEYLAKVVEERTIELRVQRDQVLKESEKLSNTLDALAEAQDELVRSERLATVGQLTKGLVDRILNPLNYINNFAGLSVELVDDLRKDLTDEKAVMSREAYEDSLEIMEMLQNNLQKITEHGANTVRIVKAMEELLKDHRSSFTQADISNLCKVNLDVVAKLFEKEIGDNDIKIDFQGLALPIMIDMHIEQMSKALLNIYKNAVYALLKRREKEAYAPELSVRVRREGYSIVIYITDNGIGIEENIQSRIFEPFFTTKPTAEAAGTGLYLSREIVLNHRGTIEVKSEKGKKTEFTITIPINQRVEIKKEIDE
ncbi:two-component system NtrC family sensor kinase [Parabacteroides sp. PFB2-12]|uniref:sensor histidine kinase n=1 Tax=unclassified Parabacteroides TaxID=2649774 RepID=UPI002476A6B9|nr:MULTISPECIES: ATP-binding protein [unclassified Parabacteroides]MDH6343123.1 two-component system NtrC family sensor kinase [Parabacteroides sp. PM6-13]MDH6390767.1 two-component system NtrC family sensor kinase [Parabacteroides sp. PFB2-12]